MGGVVPRPLPTRCLCFRDCDKPCTRCPHAPAFRHMSDVMIETIDLHRSYTIGRKSIEVLHGIDLRIRKGEKVFLCGPSGAGKTTLLYTLAGLEHPEKGSVHIGGTDLYKLGRTAQSHFRNQKIG